MTHIDIYGSSPFELPKRQRRSYSKKSREVPNFTSGLEGKLYDALETDASKIITYLTNKVGAPVIDKQYNTTTYTFQADYTVMIRQKQPPLFDPNFFDCLQNSKSIPDRRTIQFKVKMDVREDGTLFKFAFNYGAVAS